MPYTFLRTFGIVVLVALFMVSCASSRKASDDAPAPGFPQHSLDEILQYLPTVHDSLQAFRASTSIAVRAPENSNSFNADIQHRRNDSLHMTIKVSLGIEAARTLITPDSFFVYDRIKKRVILGSIEEVGEAIPLPFAGGSEAFESLLGSLQPDIGTNWTVTADKAYYYLMNDDSSQLYAIDPSIWRIVQYTQRDSSGTVVEKRTFDDFDTLDGVFMPRRIVFERPQNDVTASIYFRSIGFNPDRLDFSFNVSASVERVPISTL